jgi:hypothetical protein
LLILIAQRLREFGDWLVHGCPGRGAA